MATKRIVPLRDRDEGVVEFDDGSLIVPEYYRRFLEPGQTRINMTYVEWLRQVVDAQTEGRILEAAIDGLIAAHMHR